MIPSNRLNSITAKLFEGLPAPTAADGRVRFERPDRQSENQVLGRVDYQMTSHRIYGRYFYARYPIDPVMTEPSNFLRTQIGYLYFNQGFSASDTWTIAPNVMNSFSASYNRNHTDLVSGSTCTIADLGAQVATPPDVKELRFGVTGYFTIQSSRPAQVYRTSLQFSDSLHWIKGRHQVYFGGELLRMHVKNYNPLRQVGYFTFTRSGTDLGFALRTGGVVPDDSVAPLASRAAERPLVRRAGGGIVATVCVIGSSNLDFTVSVPQLPGVGETVSGGTLVTSPGGKGANQAVAARRIEACQFHHGCREPVPPDLDLGLRAAGVDRATVTRLVNRTPISPLQGTLACPLPNPPPRGRPRKGGDKIEPCLRSSGPLPCASSRGGGLGRGRVQACQRIAGSRVPNPADPLFRRLKPRAGQNSVDFDGKVVTLSATHQSASQEVPQGCRGRSPPADANTE
jgi:hypothetical protein